MAALAKVAVGEAPQAPSEQSKAPTTKRRVPWVESSQGFATKAAKKDEKPVGPKGASIWSALQEGATPRKDVGGAANPEPSHKKAKLMANKLLEVLPTYMPT